MTKTALRNLISKRCRGQRYLGMLRTNRVLKNLKSQRPPVKTSAKKPKTDVASSLATPAGSGPAPDAASASANGESAAPAPTAHATAAALPMLSPEAKKIYDSLPEVAKRNIALEAVRLGNYWSENRDEVLAYIATMVEDVLLNAKFMKKQASALRTENGLTKLYTVPEILAKKHEDDGYDVFITAEEAILAKEKADKKAAGQDTGPEDLDPIIYGELHEGLLEAAHAAEGNCDPLGSEELLQLLQYSARAGEVAAAVFCAEQMEASHAEGLPAELVGPIFEALKPLLRPSSCRSEPRLVGPWSETKPGTIAPPNPRRGLGLLLTRLAQRRKELELAAGGEAAEQASRMTAAEETLARICRCLFPLLKADEEAAAARRRSAMMQAISKVCKANGLEVSTPVAWELLRVLEQIGALQVQGRDILVAEDFTPEEQEEQEDQAKKGEAHQSSKLSDFAASLAELHTVAKQRLERRKKRQLSREQSKAAKRQR